MRKWMRTKRQQEIAAHKKKNSWIRFGSCFAQHKHNPHNEKPFEEENEIKKKRNNANNGELSLVCDAQKRQQQKQKQKRMNAVFVWNWYLRSQTDTTALNFPHRASSSILSICRALSLSAIGLRHRVSFVVRAWFFFCVRITIQNTTIRFCTHSFFFIFFTIPLLLEILILVRDSVMLTLTVQTDEHWARERTHRCDHFSEWEKNFLHSNGQKRFWFNLLWI